MPRDLDLDGNYTIRLTAVDPNTGAVVPGITVADLVMAIVNVGGGSVVDLSFGPYMLVPGPEG